jgi:hypothetical protein
VNNNYRFIWDVKYITSQINDFYRKMNIRFPREIEISGSFKKHLGSRFQSAGLRIQFHLNQIPGIHFKVPCKPEYKIEIINGINAGMEFRFPEFPLSASIWIVEILDHEVDSSQRAFYAVARMLIEQAYFLCKDSASIEGEPKCLD